jgi:antitoxin ParD1/3/4
VRRSRHEHERIAPREAANFVKDKVSTGRYGSSSEVVREALRLMEKAEQQEAEKLALLRQTWKEGIDSGGAGEIDFMALKKEARAACGAREDLLDIWLYVATHTSEAVADRVYDSIEQTRALLNEHLVLAEPAPKFSRKRARSSSSVGLLSIALPKTARRLCASWTAHATCRQLNTHPNEFRPLPSRRAPAGCELDQAGLTADNRPSRRPADSCLAIYLPWPKSKSLLTAQVASD